MYEHLFLHNLFVVQKRSDPSQCFIQIQLMHREYKTFELIPCDSNGRNLDYDNAKTVDMLKVINDSNKIHFKRVVTGDQYFRVVPILEGGKRIQCEENEFDDKPENLVEIKRLKLDVNYSYTPASTERKFLKVKHIPSSIKVFCPTKVECGEIGFKIGDVYIPLPCFENDTTFEGPSENISNFILCGADTEISKKYNFNQQ